MTNDKAGAPVRPMDDGVVVSVEQDEQASVDAFGIGRCGRYVVLKHTYPNGRVVFTRYAQLGRIAGTDGRPVVVGATIGKNDGSAKPARPKPCISKSGRLPPARPRPMPPGRRATATTPPWTGRATTPSIPRNSMRMSSAAESASREQQMPPLKPQPLKPQATYDDFARLDIRIGKVVECNRFSARAIRPTKSESISALTGSCGRARKSPTMSGCPARLAGRMRLQSRC